MHLHIVLELFVNVFIHKTLEKKHLETCFLFKDKKTEKFFTSMVPGDYICRFRRQFVAVSGNYNGASVDEAKFTHL